MEPNDLSPNVQGHNVAGTFCAPAKSRVRESGSGCRRAGVCFLPLFGAALVAADLSDQDVLKTLTTDQPRDKAVKKGLEFLRQKQKPDGAVGDRYPNALRAPWPSWRTWPAGHAPADKQHGAWIRKSILTCFPGKTPTGISASRTAAGCTAMDSAR